MSIRMQSAHFHACIVYLLQVARKARCYCPDIPSALGADMLILLVGFHPKFHSPGEVNGRGEVALFTYNFYLYTTKISNLTSLWGRVLIRYLKNYN